MVLRGVNFDFNSAHLTPAAEHELDTTVALLQQHGGQSAEVHGHTDSRGSPAYNLKLSERRAQAVVDYLVTHGIAASRLSAKGFGETQPVASNDTEAGRAENRRVTLTLMR